ncbi:MAG TPA: VOC family protein [Parafilimonas sp.]|nr:VOC family protein [Parafilimonas sp.]
MQLRALSPILWTKNLQETISFYETVLGFKSRSNFPNFAALCRDNAEIMFVVPTGEPDDNDFFPKPLLTGSMYIFTQDVDALWELVKDKATIKSAICNREYLMRDFSITDNNGYEIVFGEDISNRG